MKFSILLVTTLVSCAIFSEAYSTSDRGHAEKLRKRQTNADQMVQNILQWLQSVYAQNSRRIRQGTLREYLPPANTEKPRPFQPGYPPAGFYPQPPFPFPTSPVTGGVTAPEGYQPGAENGALFPPEVGPGGEVNGYVQPEPLPGFTLPVEGPSGGPTTSYPSPKEVEQPSEQPSLPEEQPAIPTGQPTTQQPGYTPTESGFPSSPLPEGGPSVVTTLQPGYPTAVTPEGTPGLPQYTPPEGTQPPQEGSTGYPPAGQPQPIPGFPTAEPGVEQPASTLKPEEQPSIPVTTGSTAEVPVSTVRPEPAAPEGPGPVAPEGPEPAAPEPTAPEVPRPTAPEGQEPVAPEGPEPVAPEGPGPIAPEGPEPIAPEGPEPAASEGPGTSAPEGPGPAAPERPEAKVPEGPGPETPEGPGPEAPEGPGSESTEGPGPEAPKGPGPAAPEPTAPEGPAATETPGPAAPEEPGTAAPEGPAPTIPEATRIPEAPVPIGLGEPGSTISPASTLAPSGFTASTPSAPGEGEKTAEGGPEGVESEGSGSTLSPEVNTIPGPGKVEPTVTEEDLKHPPHIHAIDVQCSKEMMTINIEFNREFNGVIYSKGFYNNPECRYVQENSGQTKYTFTVNLEMCGTEFVNAFDTQNQSYLENVLVLQNEAGIQEVWDTVRSVRCLWEGNLKDTLSVAFSIGMLSQEIVTFSGDTAMAKLDVVLGRGPFGEPANGLVKIGEPMTLVVSVSGDPGFDLQVKDCKAIDSESKNSVALTDEDGCILKPKLFGAFQKTKETGNTGASIIAYAYFNAFKFPDEMELMVECNIELCKTDCDMCSKENQQLEPARRRRRDVSYNSTLGDGLTMGKRLRVILPEDLNEKTALELTTRDHICMTVPNFVFSTAVLVSLLTVSSFISVFLWLKRKEGKHNKY